MDWFVAAVLLVFGAVCGVVVRLPIFVIALMATALIVLAATWPQGAGAALLPAVITVVILQAGYAAGVVLRSVVRSLQRKLREPAKIVQRRGVQVPDEPKRR